MAVPLHLCTECPICRKDVPRNLFQDHYDGHGRKRRHVAARDVVSPGEVNAIVADPSVSPDLRTVVLE